MMIPEFTTTRNAPDIATMIDTARRAGVYFPHDPSGNGDVQIRHERAATPEVHRLVAELRERRDEVNAFHGARRPAWPKRDDGIPPMPDWGSVDDATWMIQLEAHIAEAAVLNTIEEAGRELLAIRAGFAERVNLIAARDVAARRTAAPVNTTIRLRKHEPDRVVY